MNTMIDISYFFIGITLIWTISGCGGDTIQTTNIPAIDEQGLFVFLGDAIDEEKEEIPDYINAEDVLCFGQGLKVGRCISKQLETGKCLGLIKLKKKVVAVEVPCESMSKEESRSDEQGSGD